MEFSVTLTRVGGDILLYPGGNISGADLLFTATGFRVFGVFLCKERRSRRKNSVMAAAMMILVII